MQPRYIVPSVDRAFDVLNLLAQHGSLGLSRMVELSSIPKTSLYRILSTLEARRAVMADGQGEYRLGSLVLELSSHYLDGFEFHQEAYVPMRDLAAAGGETVFLAHLEDGDVVYTRRVESPQSITAVRKLGNRAPAHCTATGVAMLAFLPRAEVEALLDSNGLEAFNESTITDRDSFFERLEVVRQTGFAVVNGEYEKELLCISSPVLDHHKHPRAAITIALLSQSNPSRDKIAEIAELVKKAGAKLSRLSGYSTFASNGGAESHLNETQKSTSNGGGLMNRVVTTTARLALLLGLMIMIPGLALGQSGKIAGVVTDGDSGDSLPGATVVIDGTTIGASADAQGRYSLIGVTPGVYSIRASFVGYTPVVYDNIRVTSDRTTTLDFSLSTAVVQAGEIVVTALRPVVDQNQTTSRSLVTSEEISRLPVSSLEDVIAKTANAYNGFVRGSRRFETKTVIEGIDISDAFYSLSEGDNYFGSIYSNANKADQTSASILTVNPDAVEEVTVNSGAPGAQYSGSSGGVVAVTLAEGRGPIRGSFSFRASPSISRPGPDSLEFYGDATEYNAERAGLVDASAADPLDLTLRARIDQLFTWTPAKYQIGDKPEMDVRANVGGSLTDRLTFGLSGQFFQTYGYLPNYFRRRVNGQLKASYDVSEKTKLTAVGIVDDKGRWGSWNNTDYMNFFKYSLESVAQNDAGSYVGSIKLTQVIDENSFVSIQAYRTDNQTRYGYVDDDGDGFQEIGEDGDFIDLTDPAMVEKYVARFADKDDVNDPKMFIEDETDTFFEAALRSPDGYKYNLGRPSPFMETQKSATNAVKIDYVNQVNPVNFVQIGAEVKMRNFTYTGVQGSLPTVTLDSAEPFRVSDWERNPLEFALYASDRIEYAGLKVNAGIRVEFVDRDTEEILDHYSPFERDTVQFNGREVVRNFFRRGDDTPIDVLWNPSIGISHPIGANASMYFAYSHSEQMVPYNEIYRNYDGNHSRNRFIQLNDPEQDPIISNNFELGIQWEFTPDWGLDVNAYGRSIANYGVTTFVAFNNAPTDAVDVGMDRYTYRTDFGYADSRGIEAVIRRRPAQLTDDISLGVTASYTYSTVELGRVSGVNTRDFNITTAVNECIAAGGERDDCREQQGLQIPFDNSEEFQNFPQNVQGGSTISGGFDRRHRGIIRATSTLPFDINLGILSTIESGFLYPNAVDVDPRDRALLTGPTNYSIDFRLGKAVSFQNRYGAELFLDIKNLTNRRNVVAYDNSDLTGADVVFQETGVPGRTLVDVDGFTYYGPARTIYLGIKARF